ncbi:MAG TPA: DNA recombination protein RmuC [Gaiellaceae bacterium]|nr:DNA recombination protein RmuC [Gaiellaceae bacterium]
MVVAGILIGLVAGALVGWLAAHSRTVRVEQKLEDERRAHEERLETLNEARKELADAFQALSGEALRQNNTAFLELARTQFEGMQAQAREDLATRQLAVEQLVKPIKESLEKVDLQAQALEKTRREDYGTLKQQVTALSERTGDLVTALRSPNVRGQWGEVQLKRVVELAGMIEYCDFQTQVTATDGEGKGLRPDVVVKLPGGKHVVVDAKVPLEAYLAAAEAHDDETEAAKLQEHARQVRDHVAKLGSKRYWQHFEPAPDFVVMFLPAEALFRAALEQDAALLETSAKANVIIASPMTLIAMLRTIAAAWQQEKVAETAREVHLLGRELYERIGTLGKHFATLGRRLDGAVGAYNEAVSSVETRLLVTARKLEQHGIGDELPDVEPVERQARQLQALELTTESDEPLVTLPVAPADAA